MYFLAHHHRLRCVHEGYVLNYPSTLSDTRQTECCFPVDPKYLRKQVFTEATKHTIPYP